VKSPSMRSIIAIVALMVSAIPLSVAAEEGSVSQAVKQAGEQTGDVSSENPVEKAVTIYVPRSVHFQASGGSDLVVEPGEYRLEADGSSLRLVSSERRDSLVIQAETGTHETENEVPIGVAVQGDTEEEADQFNVVLLLPGGSSREANGTFSGIRPRGFSFKKAWSKAKKGVNLAYKQTKTVTSDVRKGADLCVTHPEQCKQKGGAIFKEKANEHLSNAAQLAKRASQEFAKESCKAFFAGQEAFAKGQEAVVRQAQEAVKRVSQDAKFMRDVIAAAESIRQRQSDLIDRLGAKALRSNNPALIKKISRLIDPNYFCENGIPATQKELAAIMSGDGEVRSRGIVYAQNIVGLQGALTYSIAGAEVGAGIVWGTDGGIRRYLFVGGTMQPPKVGGSLVIQFPFWFLPKGLDDLKGGYFAIGWTLAGKDLKPLERFGIKVVPGMQLVLDVVFSFSSPVPLGIVLSPGVSVGSANNKDFSRFIPQPQAGYTWMSR